ncbi:MAG: hypothetical protein AAF235_04910 [Planctomycetota bacterium]
MTGPRSAMVRTAWFIAGAIVAASAFGVLADRYSIRIDATLRRSHQLSDRAERVLGGLDAGDEATPSVTVIAAVDVNARDRRVVDAFRDVLDAIDAGSGSVETVFFDVGSAKGIDGLRSVIASLAARDAPIIRAEARLLDAAREDIGGLADRIEALSSPLLEASGRAGVSSGGQFREYAAIVQNLARDLRIIVERDEDAAAAIDERLPDATPRHDLFAGPLRALGSQVSAIRGSISGSPGGTSATAGPNEALDRIVRSLDLVRDDALVLRDRLERFDRPDVARIAAVLAGGEAIVVTRRAATVADTAVGSRVPTTAGIEVGRVFAGGVAGGDVLGTVRARAESVLLTGITAVSRVDRPIVVLAHPQWASIAGRRGVSELLEQRLASSGIDLLDWPAARGDPRPPVGELDPDGVRPVVYVVLPADTWAQPAELPTGDIIPSGIERQKRMAETLGLLLDDGSPVLVCLQPSVIPGFGDTDPLAAMLERGGIGADDGRVIVGSVVSRMGTFASASTRVIPGQASDAAGDVQPIMEAIRGLPLRIDRAIGLVPMDPERMRPLVRIDRAGGRWSESQWLAYLRTPLADRPAIRPQPSPDAEVDGLGPWILAAASEGDRPGEPRVVAVGGSTWLFDPAWAERGEAGLMNPGNIELLEASIAWLAGLDDLIGASAASDQTPLIEPIDTATLSWIRWGLIAGLPIVILGTGVVFRVAPSVFGRGS